MYSEASPPLPWDKECAYAREAVELYYEAHAGIVLSKREALKCLLEGTPRSLAKTTCDEQEDSGDNSTHALSSGKGSGKWVKVNEKKTLLDILRQPDFIIAGIPVFYVVSNKSPFYKEFRAGRWAPP